tara:strand:- start:229 stop:453 length:225 start_codon:yes stop_codon:yes gene_type:complete
MTKEYRVEIEAVHIIDVEANSEAEAKRKVKDANLHCLTTNPKKYIIGHYASEQELSANFHYEVCDFNNAKVSER